MPKKEKAKVTIPSAKPLYQFKVIESFHSDEFNCEYVEGHLYTVREGNEKLHNLVQDFWIPENKVRV